MSWVNRYIPNWGVWNLACKKVQGVYEYEYNYINRVTEKTKPDIKGNWYLLKENKSANKDFYCDIRICLTIKTHHTAFKWKKKQKKYIYG